MIVRRTVRLLAVGGGAVLALVGCSAADDGGACADMVRAMTEGTESIAGAVQDPATAGDQLRGFADDLRSESEGTSEAVSAAAEDLAAFYEDMADDIETGGVPDMSQLTARIGALQSACT